LLVRSATTVQQQNYLHSEAEMSTQVTHTTHEQPTTDTRLIPLRAHDQAIAKLQPALQYDTTTDPKAVDRARKDAKAVRCAIDNARKKLVEDAVAWQREVNAVAKDIIARVTPIEEHCERIEAEHAAEKKRLAEIAAQAERDRIKTLRMAEAAALQISERGKDRVMPGLMVNMFLDTPEQWQERMAAAAKVDEALAAEDAAAAVREAEEKRLQAEREELARQRAEIEAERKRFADEQAKQRAEELAKRQAEEAEARRIAQEAARKQAEEEARKAAEEADKRNAAYAMDEQKRHAANAFANKILLDFVEKIYCIRPTRDNLGFGPQLEAIIERGVQDMAAYFHDHLRDHYDARKDV
jgi:DNA repair exonuclease SbcCD ATPase subunit